MEALGRVGDREDEPRHGEEGEQENMTVTKVVEEDVIVGSKDKAGKDKGAASEIQNVSDYNPQGSSSTSVCPYTGDVVELGGRIRPVG